MAAFGLGRRSMPTQSSSAPGRWATAMRSPHGNSFRTWLVGWTIRIQLTTDGNRVYLEAVAEAFGADVDYAMLVKLYGEDLQGKTRYSPAVCNGARKEVITGSPAHQHVSTSYVERQNLTMRMHMRRFTRLTNGFSKKIENHAAAISLRFIYYNFVRIHQTLRVTPAMAAGVTDRVWDVADIVNLLDDKSEKLDRADATFGPVLGHDPIGSR